jgi:hypothetical protein
MNTMAREIHDAAQTLGPLLIEEESGEAAIYIPKMWTSLDEVMEITELEADLIDSHPVDDYFVIHFPAGM